MLRTPEGPQYPHVDSEGPRGVIMDEADGMSVYLGVESRKVKFLAKSDLERGRRRNLAKRRLSTTR